MNSEVRRSDVNAANAVPPPSSSESNSQSIDTNTNTTTSTMNTTDTTTLTTSSTSTQPTSRIVPANEKQIENHKNEEKTNALPVDTAKIMSVVLNQTLNALPLSKVTTSIDTVPLSSYVFGSVSKDIGSGYGVTPFLMTDEIPQLFKLVAVHNAQQQTNPEDMTITQITKQEVLGVVSKSIELFNTSTLTVRVVLNDKIGQMPIIDPNDTSNGVIELKRVGPEGRQNAQNSVNMVESRFFSVINAFIGLDNLLIKMPKKITCLDSVRGGPVAQALSQMPFYDQLQPHPFYAVFTTIPQWFRTYLEQCFIECPLNIGESVVTSVGGKKLCQFNHMIIDQYTAKFLQLNYRKLKSGLLTNDRLYLLLDPCIFPHDKLSINSIIDVDDFTMLYNYSSTEYDLAMFTMNTTLSIKKDIINFLNEQLIATNRVNMAKIEEVWSDLLISDSASVSFNNKWIKSLAIGDKTSPVSMLLMETFSDWFDIKPIFGPLPSSLEAIQEIIQIYMHILLFPRISQRIIHRLGNRLTSLFSTAFKKIFDEFVLQYGDVRIKYGEEKYNSTGLELNMTHSQCGYIHSIFCNNKIVAGRNLGEKQKTLNQFITLLNNLRAQVIPVISKTSLDKKQRAGYPYMYDTYETYMSWKPIDYNDYYSNKRTEIGTRISKLISTADELKSLLVNQDSASREVPQSYSLYYASWTRQLSNVACTVGPAMQLTMAMLQKTLFESPFYTGSLYNPHPSRFFHVPNSVGIGAIDSADLTAVVVPRRIEVGSYRTNIAMVLALTLEGEYSRDTITPRESDDSVEQVGIRRRDEITSLDGVELFKMANRVVSYATRYGAAMQLAQWMVTTNDPNNPFASISSELAKYMRMSSWVPLTKKIFALFGLDFSEYFIETISGSSFVVDGRYLDRTLVLIDPATNAPVKNNPVNSKFGRKFTYMLPIDIQKIELLCRPLLSADSRIIHVQSDWYFGNLIVDEMGPTQYNLAKTNWTDETNLDNRCIFKRVKHKHGQAAQLTYYSLTDQQEKTMLLPFTTMSTPILLLNITYMSDIPIEYITPLAKAIVAGKIVLRIKKLKLRVLIEDKPSRTIDYSQNPLTEAEAIDILYTPDGSIRDETFVTTNYATNFTSNAFVIPGYRQRFATTHEADTTLFMSTITNATEKPAQCILPTSDELGFGPSEDGSSFNDNVEKIKSNVINWNNSVPTISDKLVNNINVVIESCIPQHLG
uniref:Uncharacterized protein n=1 Tax=Hubei diptera virus 20 TaxID=1922881 RepID=A0A1L3KP78_9VIRU|nr:hypothetical protein 1 [Hubei diptera virus 20]